MHGVSTQTMSSSPAPRTIKVTPLYSSRPRKSKNPSSFRSFAKFSLFRKEPSHQSSSPIEPYEVAPGIWSTDATARVFGYLDTSDKEAKSNVQSAGREIRAPVQMANRKAVPIRNPLDECKKAHFAERTEQCNNDTARKETGASNQFMQERRDDPRISRRERMRTVSRDDQLVERGANPRTGLVSPSIVSDDSEECCGGDYIAVGNVGLPCQTPRRKTRSGKWTQDSFGWSLVESPLLSPVAPSMSDKISRTATMKHLEGRIPVEMTGVDDPGSEYMTDGQIKKYQEDVARAYKRGGGNVAMLDPDALSSSRQWAPEGPSTPPTKLHKIQRKEVGSGMFRKSNSSDTVIVNANNQAYSLIMRRKDIMKRQKVRIITPSNTPKGSSFESCADISNAMTRTNAFLGRGSRMTCSQTASATQSQSCLNTHQCLQNESKSGPKLSDPLPASPTLSQYLPRLQFLHPSVFANPETSSSYRPTQILPARLRTFGRQRQAVEDVCTATFTTTSTKGPRWGQRPKIQRQEKNRIVPRVKHLSPQCETPLDGYSRERVPINKQPYPIASSVDIFHTSGLVRGRSQAIRSTEKADRVGDLAKTRRCQRKTPTPGECLRQPPCENRPRNIASPMLMAQGLGLGGANVTRERIQQNPSGDGCTPTYDHLGIECNESRAVPGVRLQDIANDKEQATLPERTVGGDGRARVAGQSTEVEEEGERPELTTLMGKESLARRRSLLKKATDMKIWLHAAEAWIEPLAKLSLFQRILHQMICHIMRTCHHASPALTTLRKENATIRDYFGAMKDLALAAVYLLVLLNLFMALKRVLAFVGQVLFWVWHPVQTILVIIGWCVVG